MPKSSKKSSKKLKRKVRATKKKYKKKIARIKGYKKGGKKKFWKKFKGNKGLYKFKKAQGIKWSIWCSLSQFLSLPHQSWLKLALMANFNQSDTSPAAPKSNSFTLTYVAQAKETLSKMFTVFSTDVMDSQRASGLTETERNKLRWTAWNPVLSPYTLGPMFYNMINIYKNIKYCGVKVSWKPNVKLHPSFNPPIRQTKYTKYITTGQSASAQTGTQYNLLTEAQGAIDNEYEVINENLYANLDQKYRIDPPNGYQQYAEYNWSWYQPPVFRLWVNFDKQGYESVDWCPEKIIYQTTGNPSDSKLLNSTRLKQRCIYDTNGIPNHFATGLVKSYPLNRPFKFYCKPKLSTKMFEQPENETVLSNAEKVPTQFQRDLKSGLNNSNVVQMSMKKVPYFSINNLYPVSFPWWDMSLGLTANQQNNFYCMNNLDQCFFDPILFSTFVTLDGLSIENTMCPYTIASLGNKTAAAPNKEQDFSLIDMYYLKSLGKFKVTFYAKFKGVKQMLPNPAVNVAQINALNEDEHATMDLETIDN